jgi:CelD/BcsL family acetyltransferase involved in cellulose biosynthesis
LRALPGGHEGDDVEECNEAKLVQETTMRDDSMCLEKSMPEPGPNAHAPGATPAGSAALYWEVYGPQASPRGFEALAPEWNALLKRSRFDNFFSTYEWQTTWWDNLGTGALWIVALRRADTKALVGIAPLYLITLQSGPDAGKRQLNLVGCIEVSDYLDLIVEQGWEHSVYEHLLRWLQGPEAPAWDIFDLCNLPEVSPTYRDLAALYAASGLQVEVFQEDTAPQFTLPRRFEDYLQNQVDKKQRHEIRRKQRRAEREATIGLMLVGKQHVLEAEVDDFVALQRASREDKAEFMTPEMRRFFLAVARRTLDMGVLRLFFLTINGEKAATMFAFEYNRRFWLYNSGYDPQAYAQLSPGWVILAYVIEYAIAAGCSVFDFMQGNEEYKYRFGAEDYKVMRVVVRRSA